MSLAKKKKKNLIIPKFGEPRKAIKQYPKGTYAIRKETSYFKGKYIYERKRPLYHVVRVMGFVDMKGTFGGSGLRTRKISTHYDLSKAKKKIKVLNLNKRKKRS